MCNVLYTVCCYANSPRWYMGLVSIESVSPVDYTSNCLYLQLTPALSNNVTVISFTYQEVTAFVKRT